MPSNKRCNTLVNTSQGFSAGIYLRSSFPPDLPMNPRVLPDCFPLYHSYRNIRISKPHVGRLLSAPVVSSQVIKYYGFVEAGLSVFLCRAAVYNLEHSGAVWGVMGGGEISCHTIQ